MRGITQIDPDLDQGVPVLQVMTQGWILASQILGGEAVEQQLAEVIEDLKKLDGDGVFYAGMHGCKNVKASQRQRHFHDVREDKALYHFSTQGLNTVSKVQVDRCWR